MKNGTDTTVWEERVSKLNVVRDKLTQELDLQVEETERLAAENATLTQVQIHKLESLSKFHRWQASWEATCTSTSFCQALELKLCVMSPILL